MKADDLEQNISVGNQVLRLTDRQQRGTLDTTQISVPARSTTSDTPKKINLGDTTANLGDMSRICFVICFQFLFLLFPNCVF